MKYGVNSGKYFSQPFFFKLTIKLKWHKVIFNEKCHAGSKRLLLAGFKIAKIPWDYGIYPPHTHQCCYVTVGQFNWGPYWNQASRVVSVSKIAQFLQNFPFEDI